MAIKAIIFDFGGVIANVDLDTLYKGILQHSALPKTYTKDRFFAEFLSSDLQKGIITPETMHQKLVRDIRLTLSFEELKKLWISIIGDQIPSTIKLLTQLKGHYELYLFSTCEPFTYEGFKHKIPPVFTKQFLSFEIGYVKTEHAAFEHVLHAIHHQPDECIFIDDIAVNLVAAKNLGIHTIHYTPQTNLQAELAHYGVRPA